MLACDDPSEDDTTDAPAGASGGKPTGWEPTVADYMRGTSGTDYDDPVWDLPPEQVNAELVRRAQAKADAAAEREPELRRPEAEPGAAVDKPVEPDDPESAGSWLVRRGDDVNDAANKAQDTVNAFRHLPDTPTGHPAVRVQDRPSGPVVSPGQQHMDAGSVATATMIMVVAANRLRDQINEWRRRDGD